MDEERDKLLNMKELHTAVISLMVYEQFGYVTKASKQSWTSRKLQKYDEGCGIVFHKFKLINATVNKIWTFCAT